MYMCKFQMNRIVVTQVMATCDFVLQVIATGTLSDRKSSIPALEGRYFNP